MVQSTMLVTSQREAKQVTWGGMGVGQGRPSRLGWSPQSNTSYLPIASFWAEPSRDVPLVGGGMHRTHEATDPPPQVWAEASS